MTNDELKASLSQNGVTVAEIEKFSEKFDAEKISEIVEQSDNPAEALHKFYPELEIKELQKQCDFVIEQVEASLKIQKSLVPMELSEEELDNVSGGGWFSDIGDWCQKNWKAMAVGAAIVVGTALVCTGVGAAIGALVGTGIGGATGVLGNVN